MVRGLFHNPFPPLSKSHHRTGKDANHSRLVSEAQFAAHVCLQGRLWVCHIDIFLITFPRMKTTVDIPNSWLEQTKRLALREHTTVRALMEEGLRKIVAERKRAKAFRLRKASFRGKGLQPQMAGAGVATDS